MADTSADSSGHSTNGTSSSSTGGSSLRHDDENLLPAVAWTESIYGEPFPADIANEIHQTLDLRKVKMSFKGNKLEYSVCSFGNKLEYSVCTFGPTSHQSDACEIECSPSF